MKKTRLLYILSPSFSGSTLLTMLLAIHSRIATIGELKATSMGPVEDYRCSCGAPILECSFWSGLQEVLTEQGQSFSFSGFGTHFTSINPFNKWVLEAQVRGQGFELMRRCLLTLAPSLRSEFGRLQSTNLRFMHAICQLQDGDVFLDGSKDPQRLSYFHSSGFYEVDVIQMYRDGRAQSNSHRKKLLAPEQTFADASKEWLSTIKQMDLVAREIRPKRIYTLRYEDLCSDPAAIMADLFQWLGLAPLNLEWTDIDLKKNDLHLLGNQMRTQDAIRVALDESWRKQVSIEDCETFDQIAGVENRALGY